MIKGYFKKGRRISSLWRHLNKVPELSKAPLISELKGKMDDVGVRFVATAAFGFWHAKILYYLSTRR